MGKIKNCEYCGSEFEDKHRDGKRFCNQKCSAQYYKDKRVFPDRSGSNNANWKGARDIPCDTCGNPLGEKAYFRSKNNKHKYCSRKCYGIGRTSLLTVSLTCPVCKKKFVVAKHDEGKRKYCSSQCVGKDPKENERKSVLHKGKVIEEWHRQACSEAAIKRSAEKVYTSGKNGHHESPKAGVVYYRSSYELIGYKILDDDLNIQSYETEPVAIKYENKEGNTRRYQPDILVKKKNGSFVLIEIKPKWQLKEEKVQLKLEAGKKFARQNGWKFEVWTEKELGISNG